MRVSLDTNVLHQEGFNSQSMRLLQRLIIAGFVKLYISRIVLREHDTKRYTETCSRLQSVRDNLLEINKAFLKSGAQMSALSRLESQIEKLAPDLDASREASTEAWLRDFQIEIIEADAQVHELAWDDYFSGNGAFKRAKNREDIPDAVIARSLERLASDEEELTFICKDGQLKKFMSEVPGVRVFSELSEFISSPDAVNKLNELDSHDKAIEAYKAAIASEEFLVGVIKYFSAPESDFQYATWQGEEIESKSGLPLVVYGEPVVKGVVAQSVKSLRFGPVASLAPRHYVVPISFTANARFIFLADYNEWLQAPDDVKEWVDVISSDRAGLCKFSALQACEITGQVDIHFPEGVTPESMLIHANYIGADDSPLDIEFIPGKVVV
ncbi:PIN domain-containing protein [Pseudomonas inefficax]|uniref:PIN domain-containing protein n=1 Tax=Pseudomonas inefficax TaxID=2078786 RepID=UPI0028BEAD73|nr:PIN domain-containing protein [Pseudomonas inefficax]WNN41285.1 PIN domain-containing protein [Pseudomonas inefficax]